MSEPVCCGNIYADPWYLDGKRHVSYYIDCADCGVQWGLVGIRRGRSAKRVAKSEGWCISAEHGKWICPDCAGKRSDSVTHSELVERAKRWLRGTMKCGVVLTEMHSMSHEVPDAIGWNSCRSILVECKTSRADFLSDAQKPFRAYPEMGMGDYRYYLTPPGLIEPEELPRLWGLLEVRKQGVHVRHVAGRFPITGTALRERPLLFSALRRAQEKGA